MNLDKYKFTKYFSGHSESRFATSDEIKAGCEKVNLTQETHGTAGLPVLNNGKEAYVDAKDNHSLIFGSTGSKKSRLFCMPTLRFLIGAGESFVASDPKGELFIRTAGAAKANGYEVVVLNYRDLHHSDSWNPLAVPYTLYHKGDKEAAVERLNDFVSTIAERHEAQSRDIFWISAAKSVALSILITMLEVCTFKEYNLRTFTRFCTEFAKGMTDPLSIKVYNLEESDIIKNSLYDLMQLIPKDHIARLNYEGIASSSDKAKGDVQSTLFTLIGLFVTQETLVQNMSRTSFDIASIGVKKTAVYIIVPDERTSYHFIASTFIKQCYELLIGKAQESENRQLPVRVNFMLDEFANLPKIPDMPSMISAARSRNIRFFLVLQSMHQMKEKYGEEAETIKGNCENWVFLASKEIELLTEISKLCGQVSYDDENGDRKQPLISISQLQRLSKDRGEALLFCGRQYPFISEMADIDDCAFPVHPPYTVKETPLHAAASTDPKEILEQIENGERTLPFSGGKAKVAVQEDEEEENAVSEDSDFADLSEEERLEALTAWQEEVFLSNEGEASTRECVYYDSVQEAEKAFDVARKSKAESEEESERDAFLRRSEERFGIHVASDYDIMENEDGDILFMLSYEGEESDKAPQNPRLYYDGREHAVLLCENFPPILCDYVHVEVRQSLLKQKEVLFAFFSENEEGNSKLSTEFMAPLIVCDDLQKIVPFDLD